MMNPITAQHVPIFPDADSSRWRSSTPIRRAGFAASLMGLIDGAIDMQSARHVVRDNQGCDQHHHGGNSAVDTSNHRQTAPVGHNQILLDAIGRIVA
jgi:hypothetical protein